MRCILWSMASIALTPEMDYLECDVRDTGGLSARMEVILEGRTFTRSVVGWGAKDGVNH